MKTSIALCALILVPVMLSPALAQDPGRPDSLLIGCVDSLNLDPIPVSLGQHVVVPLWLKIDDSVTFISIPLATDDDYVASRDGAVFDDTNLCYMVDKMVVPPDPDSPREGYTNQSALFFSEGEPYRYCGPSPVPPPTMSYEWWHIGDFLMTMTSDTTVLGDSTSFIEGHNLYHGGLFFGNWEIGFVPQTIWGRLRFSDYPPGDANGDALLNGLDIVFLVNYLKGIGPAPDPLLRADANGDCITNGLDVVYLVNYLKGIGPAPFGGNCR